MCLHLCCVIVSPASIRLEKRLFLFNLFVPPDSLPHESIKRRILGRCTLLGVILLSFVWANCGGGGSHIVGVYQCGLVHLFIRFSHPPHSLIKMRDTLAIRANWKRPVWRTTTKRFYTELQKNRRNQIKIQMKAQNETQTFISHGVTFCSTVVHGMPFSTDVLFAQDHSLIAAYKDRPHT